MPLSHAEQQILDDLERQFSHPSHRMGRLIRRYADLAVVLVAVLAAIISIVTAIFAP